VNILDERVSFKEHGKLSGVCLELDVIAVEVVVKVALPLQTQ
jgi:hypothetical protein